MDSGMIGKIQKAKQYAEERDRIEFRTFSVVLHGDNHDHSVSYEMGQWQCECSYLPLTVCAVIRWRWSAFWARCYVPSTRRQW